MNNTVINISSEKQQTLKKIPGLKLLIRSTLMQQESVRDCYILEKQARLIVYVVSNQSLVDESLAATLTTVMPESMAFSLVHISCLPLTEAGDVDEAALGAVPIIDETLAKQLENQLKSIPEINNVAVLIQDRQHQSTRLHVADLLVNRQEDSKQGHIEIIPEKDDLSLLHSQESVIKPLAISDGGNIEFDPEDGLTLSDLLQDATAKAANKTIVYLLPDGTEKVQSYSALLQEAKCIHAGLILQGLRAKDNVIFLLEKNQDVIPAFWACMLGGFVPVIMEVPSHFESSNRAYQHICQLCQRLDAQLIITDSGLHEDVKQLQDSLSDHVLSIAVVDELRENIASKPFHVCQSDDIAFFCLTSGSSGTPKCVPMTHENVMIRNQGTNIFNQHDDRDVYLNWLPFDHIGSLAEHIRCLVAVCNMVYMDKEFILSNPLNMLHTIDKYRITHTWGPNFIYALIRDALKENTMEYAWDLSSVKFLISGGEAVSSQIMADFLARAGKFGFPITGSRPSFGMAEVCAGITYAEPGEDPLRSFFWIKNAAFNGKDVINVAPETSGASSFANLGRPIPGVSIRIVDQAQQILTEDIIGHVQLKGGLVLNAYYEDSELNVKSFSPDGWLDTGDLGFISDGKLVLTGRAKQMLIINGSNYYSHEIEDVVEQIKDVEVSYTAACAVRDKNSVTDKLAVFFHPLVDDDPSLKALIQQIRQTIVSRIHLNPDYIIPVEKIDIPKTPIGKIQHMPLSESFNQGLFDDKLKVVDILLENENTLPAWFARKVWEPAVIVPPALSEERAYTLIFGGESDLASYLCQHLQERGVAAAPISKNKQAFDPDNPQHYRDALKSILDQGTKISDIICLDAYGKVASPNAGQQVSRLLFLLQALAELQAEKPTRLFYISDHSQYTHEHEDVEPEKSAVLGIIKTIPHEMPWLKVCHIDLPLSHVETDGNAILQEFFALSKEQEVAYRDGQRLVCRLERMDWHEPAQPTEIFKQHGVYLIIGGLGGIGEQLSRYLLQNYSARLVLVGRSPLQETSTVYQQLTQLDGEIVYQQADVCNENQLKQVAESLSRWQKHPDGVIHLAGAYQDKLLLDETPESMDDILGAKIRSSQWMNELFCHSLDTFFIYFSSLAGHFGGFGSAAYSAANAYLERFAQQQRKQGVASYCLAWTQWVDTGMNQGRHIQDSLQAKKGFLSITSQQGMVSFAAAMKFAINDMMIGLDMDNPNIAAQVKQAPFNTKTLHAYASLKTEAPCLNKVLPVVDCLGNTTEYTLATLGKLPLLDNGEVNQEVLRQQVSGEAVSSLVAPRNKLESLLVDAWQDVLGNQVGIHDNFFDLGGSSIKAVMVMNKFQEKIGSIFHPVSLFDAPTIAELAEYFKENYPALFKTAEQADHDTEQSLTDKQINHMRDYLTHSLSSQSVKSDLTGNKSKRAVFILSPARSGSTLLRVILAGNPQLFSPPELYLLGFNHLREHKEFYSGRLSFLQEGVIRAIMEIKGCNQQQAEQTVHELERQNISVKQLFALMQQWLGQRMLVDKTPPYAFNPDILQRMEQEFADPLYIHLVRHPAGMIASFEEARVDLAVDVHGDESPDMAFTARQKGELWWMISHQNIRSFLKNIPAQRQHVVKFEDLVTQPKSTVEQLCQFMDIDFCADMLEPQKGKKQRMTDGAHQLSRMAGDPKFHSHQGISAKAADRWKQVYAKDFLSEATWQIARDYGYRFDDHVSFGDFQIKPDPANRHQPFPLTDIQQAYWAGRIGHFELGGYSVHSYTEVDSVNLDVRRLNQAWQKMINRHEMLRTIILPDGQQQILENIPKYNIRHMDLRCLDSEGIQIELDATREAMSHQVFTLDQWPLFDIVVSRMDDNKYRVHLSFDAILFDARSRYIIYSELRQFYQQPELQMQPFELSFRDYVLMEEKIKNSSLYEQSRDYWLQQIPSLPETPELPLAINPSELARPKFIQKNHFFEKSDWSRLKTLAAQQQITPSCLLLTVFSDVLRIWNKLDSFTINLTAYNRQDLHKEVNHIIGDFTSVILLGIDAPGNDSFISRAHHVQKRLWNNINHNHFSGIEVLRELAKRNDHKPGAQMPVVFTSVLGDEIQDTSQKTTDWLGDVVFNVAQTPQIWFDHVTFEEGGGLLCRWNIVDKLFPEGLMDAMFDGYLGCLQRLLQDERAWQEPWPKTAKRLVSGSPLEQRQLANATEAPVSGELLHTLFATQCVQRPQQTAVIAADKSLSYQQLYELSNQIGHRLQKMGVQPNQLVAVVMEKGWQQVAAVLGILASGAAYLPIDPELPEERFQHLLEFGQVDVALTEASLQKLMNWPDNVQRLCVDDVSLAEESRQAPAIRQSPEDLAYVIFTSGSTGLPKGVMIDHRGAVNTIRDINARFNVGFQDKTIALSALNFDLSVYDIFGMLAVGGTIVMPQSSDVRNSQQWLRLVNAHQVTIWNTVPAFVGLLTEYVESRPEISVDSLRLIMMSGDWIPLNLSGKIQQRFNQSEVISLGGATEVSIWSILYPIKQLDPAWKSIPYGKPMHNQQFHVLNSAMEDCPVWVPGNLYIGGIGLAKGYWRDAEKTAKAFITHPGTGERLYHTGDLGRYLPDGNIEFLGREDFQVKIQGFRVEIGEIEAALSQHPEVKAAVVDAKGAAQAEKQLVAYFVPVSDAVLSAEALQDFLRQKLPAYMIPASYVVLSELPLSANGKVDRKALPEPSAALVPKAVSSEHQRQQPTSDVSSKILQLVEQVLAITDLAYEDNIFNFGATSIHMMRIINQMEMEFGVRPQIDAFYMNPTISGLVAAYEEVHGSQTDNSPASVSYSNMHGLSGELLDRFEFITDPELRNAFKEQQLGIRYLDLPSIPLAKSKQLNELYDKRRSCRSYSSTPVARVDFGELLSCLSQETRFSQPKYLYGSAGGLYPIQTYLYIKPDRIESLEAGIYYYHPLDHRLVLLASNVELDERIYNPHINRPIYEQAAFSLFFVSQLAAIAPMYKELALHFSVLEAGLMSQLLETHAPDVNLGLCQIGEVDFNRVRHLFDLDDSHVLVHSLVGGIPTQEIGNAFSYTGMYGDSSVLDQQDREEEEF